MNNKLLGWLISFSTLIVSGTTVLTNRILSFYVLNHLQTNICNSIFVVFSFCAASYCDASWIYGRLWGVQYLSEEDPSRLEVGESIYFSCEKGYRLRGASSVKCLPTGDLEGTGLLTECESKYLGVFLFYA